MRTERRCCGEMQPNCINTPIALDTQSGHRHASWHPGQFDKRYPYAQSSTGLDEPGCCRVSGKTPGSWKPKQSGNPGGRASTTKALIAAGEDPDKWRAEVVQRNIKEWREIDPRNPDLARTWLALNDKAWILASLPAKPVEQGDERGALTDEEYQEELDIIARERIAKMSPEEKMRLLASPSTEVVQ